jgi:hypothetical protein
MRSDPLLFAKTEEDHKNMAFNELRTDFSKAILKRFHEIKGNIEDIWDIVQNKGLLFSRLQTIAAKDPADLTENNLKDMALICCILWNGVDPTLPED